MSEKWEPLKIASHKLEWPVDHSGWMLLPRAAERVGAALWGSAWTGQEMGAADAYPGPIPPNPNRSGWTADERALVHHLISTHRPDLDIGSLGPPSLARVVAPAPPSLNELFGILPLRDASPGGAGNESAPKADAKPFVMNVVWAGLACQIQATLEAEHRAKLVPLTQRREAVVALMRREGVLGGLKAGWQTVTDGSVVEIPGTVWNLDCWRSYFLHCKIDWERFSLSGTRPAYLMWMFVRAADVDAIAAKATIERRDREGAIPLWWPKEPRESVKEWTRRAEVQAEALLRMGSERTRDAYRVALEAMWAESSRTALAPDTIRRNLTGGLLFLPAGVS